MDISNVLNESKKEKNNDTEDEVRVHKKPIQLRDIENRSSSNRGDRSIETDAKITELIKKEKEAVFNQPWNKLDKGLKINRIRAFIEQEQNERNISKKQREQLETILLTACRGNKLNKLSDVNYDIESGVIISLKLLDYSEEKGYSLRTPETKVTRTTGKSRSNIERFIKR